MNESSNVTAALIMALSQLQQMKDKIDPEAYVLLQQSAHEAINSAHTFLDACEKIVDSLAPETEIDLTKEPKSEVIEFKKAKSVK